MMSYDSGSYIKHVSLLQSPTYDSSLLRDACGLPRSRQMRRESASGSLLVSADGPGLSGSAFVLRGRARGKHE